MRNTANTIVKNATVLMGSQMTTWLLTILFMVFLPRYLGPAAMGRYFIAVSLWEIVGKFVSFGMNRFLTKEIARDPSKASALFSTTIILRCFLHIVGYILVYIYFRIFEYADDTVAFVYFIGIDYLTVQFVGASQATLQGLEKMKFMAIGNVVGKLVSTLLGIIALVLGYKIFAIAIVIIFSRLINLIIQLIYLQRLSPLQFRYNARESTSMLRQSIPYLLSGLFLIVYMRMDVVIMSMFVDEHVVGWYGTASQLFGTFLFVPTVFMTAIFPVFSRMYTNEPNAVGRLMAKSFNTLLMLSVPIGLGITAIANPLVIILFGEQFANSGPVLAILGIVLILTYQTILLGQFLASIDRQNSWTVVMAVAALATIVLDFILIPWSSQVYGNGAIGGALAYIVTELGMIVAGLLLLPQGTLDSGSLRTATQIIFVGLIMACVVWLTRGFFIAVPIVAGVVVYGSGLFALRVVPQEDFNLFKELIQGFLGRIDRLSIKPASS